MAANFEKDPSENLDYQVSWADWLATGESIVTSTWTVETGLTAGTTSASSTVATIWLSGGTNGDIYNITNHIISSASRTGDRTFSIEIKERTFASTSGTTARSLITRALSLIGALSEGDSPTGQAADDALSTLNDLITGWQAEGVPAYTITRATHAISGASSYTVGEGGDFNRAWPYRIDHAGLLLTSSTPDVETPMRVLLEQEWQALGVKDVTSTLPTSVYYNPTYPLGRLHVYPVASDTTATLVLYLPEPVATLATLNTVVSLPPGYEKALRYNLALELCPEYGRPVDPVVQTMATSSLAALKRANFRPMLSRVDPALLGSSSLGRYNVRTDTGG